MTLFSCFLPQMTPLKDRKRKANEVDGQTPRELEICKALKEGRWPFGAALIVGDKDTISGLLQNLEAALEFQEHLESQKEHYTALMESNSQKNSNFKKAEHDELCKRCSAWD